MFRASLATLLLLATPALAQPAPPPAAAGTTGAKDVPMARLLTDGAQVRGVDTKDRLVLQLGRYVFLCRAEAGKPGLCDVMP
jgi:hypothetical protein